MNKKRRQNIQNLINQLTEISKDIENLADEEKDYFENMPESFQQAEKGDLATESISCLEDARLNTEEAIISLQKAGG